MNRFFALSILLSFAGGAVAYLYMGSSSSIPLPPREPVRGPAAKVPVSADAPAVSARPQVERAPKAQDPIQEIRSRSQGKWVFRRDRTGALKRMSGGALPLGSRAAVVSASEFLRLYARSLLGVDPTGLEIKSAPQEDQVTQVLFEQVAEGLPVFGSRLNLFFDREGNLVYLVSDLHSGSFPSAAASVSPAAAAASAREAVVRRLESEGYSVESDQYGPSELSQLGVLGYRYYGEEASLVYKFEIPLSDPHHGDYEVIVDAVLGSVVSIKSLSRN